jgi:competence protein ComEC
MTKRLFAYIGLTMLITFSAVFYFGIYGIAAALITSVGIIICAFAVKSYRKSRKVLILVATVCILSVLYFCVYNSITEISRSRYNDKSVTLEAVIKDSHINNDYHYYELKCEKIISNPENYKILLKTSEDLGAEYGDIITCKVNLHKTENSYYKSKGFDYSAKSESYYLSYSIRTVREKGIDYLPVFIREKLTYSVNALIEGYEGELCNAIALGDKFGLSDEVYNDFKNTGLSYIIVISGLHMTLAAAFIMIFFKKFRKGKIGRWVCAASVFLFILLYMAVTGFASSAVRSGIMIIILYGGYAFSRQSDAFNNLGLAALLLTILNPFAVGDVGMLMSFSTVAGILLFNHRIMNRFDLKFSKRINNLYVLKNAAKNRTDKNRVNAELFSFSFLRKTVEFFSVSICAVAAISPLTLIFYGVFNPFVFIYSVFVSPFVGALMLFTVFTAVLYYIPVLNLLAFTTALIARALSGFIIAVVSCIAKIPYLTFYFEPLNMKIWFMFTAVLFVGVFAVKFKRRNVIIAGFLSLMMLITSLGIGYLNESGKTSLKILSSGNGSTVVFKSPENLDVLSSGGSAYNYEAVSEKLHILDGKINLLVVQSPNDNPDMKLSKDILGEFDVEKVLLYYRYNTNERVYRLARECKRYKEFNEGESISVRLSSSVVDEIVNVNNHTFQYISDGNVSALITPYKGKLSEIPDKFRNPDYLIINNDIENIEELNYGEAIWTSVKNCPKKLRNATKVEDKDFTIDFN